MKIETKFWLGDLVKFKDRGVLQSANVHHIRIDISPSGIIRKVYILNNEEHPTHINEKDILGKVE